MNVFTKGQEHGNILTLQKSLHDFWAKECTIPARPKSKPQAKWFSFSGVERTLEVFKNPKNYNEATGSVS